MNIITKRLLLGIFCILFLSENAHSALLKRIQTSETKDKLRLVLEFDSAVTYSVNKSNTYTVIDIQNTNTVDGIPNYIQSRLLQGISIYCTDESCQVTANYKYLTSGNIIVLKNPFRIVADFKKLSNYPLPKLSVPEIDKITTRAMPDKFKIVIGLSSIVPYNVTTSESGLLIELPNTNSVIKSRKFITKDKLIPKIAVDQVGTSVFVSIAQAYPSFYQIYKLDTPSGIAIEFDRASKATIAAKDYSTGFKYAKVIKGNEEGPATVNAIFVDQKLYNVMPYMPIKEEDTPSVFGAIGDLFTFWVPKEEVRYYKETVSSMVERSNAMAGINGTYFGSIGEPLGVLMINGELISYSIHDRTALIIDKENKCYIDNVSLSGEVLIEGRTISISGINTKRSIGEAMVYTPRYGNETREDSPGIVLSVVNNEVKNISRARAWIPKDGYVISLDPAYYETLGTKVKLGSKVALTLKLTPLSSIQNLDIKHVVGGGPRLLKSGQIYISKNSEHFKNDISKSRTSRTAVGIATDGTLILATVDKCKAGNNRAKSVGVTLEELAQIMKDLGCVDAMNLDGGGSSTMVISSEVINCPASGNQVPVSNSLIIKKP